MQHSIERSIEHSIEHPIEHSIEHSAGHSRVHSMEHSKEHSRTLATRLSVSLSFTPYLVSARASLRNVRPLLLVMSILERRMRTFLPTFFLRLPTVLRGITFVNVSFLPVGVLT